MLQILRLTRDHTDCFKNNDLDHIYDLRILNSPINLYVKNIQQNCLIGCINWIINKFCLQLTKEHALAQVNCLDEVCLEVSQNLFISLQHNFKLTQKQNLIVKQTKWVEHYTSMATAHFWLNESLLLHHNPPLVYGHIVHKDKLLSSLQNIRLSLIAWKHTIIKIQTEIEQHAISIAQHLQWSGNAVATQLLEAFNEQVNLQKIRSQVNLDIVVKLCEYVEVLLQFELMQQGTLSADYLSDRDLMDLLVEWQDYSTKWNQSSNSINAVERAIVQLLDPEGKVDQCWIENICGLLDEMTYGVQKELASLENEQKQLKENCAINAQQLQVCNVPNLLEIYINGLWEIFVFLVILD